MTEVIANQTSIKASAKASPLVTCTRSLKFRYLMWRMFFSIVLPNVKWSLLYGVLLCNARAMGEFGAVSVVSGHIRGQTNTIPLHVEILYNEYQFAAAFAVASLLALLALVTLVLKSFVEWRTVAPRSLKAAPEGRVATLSGELP